MKNKEISTSNKGHARHGQWHKLFGILLALFGFFWLAKKVGWIPVAAGGSVIFWPLLTIMLGLWFAFGKHRAKTGDNKFNIKYKEDQNEHITFI